jgi:hypothetical protein
MPENEKTPVRDEAEFFPKGSIAFFVVMLACFGLISCARRQFPRCNQRLSQMYKSWMRPLNRCPFVPCLAQQEMTP